MRRCEWSDLPGILDFYQLVINETEQTMSARETCTVLKTEQTLRLPLP